MLTTGRNSNVSWLTTCDQISDNSYEYQVETADYSTSEMLVNMGSLPLDEFYPAVAIVTLMRILRDPLLSNHHTMVVQAVTFIFKSLGLKCVQFLPQVMPTFLNVIRVCDASIREFLFQQMGMVVCFVKIHIQPYMDDIFTLIRVAFVLWKSQMLTKADNWGKHFFSALYFVYQIFIPMVNKVMLKHRINHQRFDVLIC
ncbi:hypothetical protein cypCar_00037849 [Cyprinus carpio]|nr:hypothetical protein cypCar_00037849 [Cyprinus carpio]